MAQEPAIAQQEPAIAQQRTRDRSEMFRSQSTAYAFAGRPRELVPGQLGGGELPGGDLGFDELVGAAARGRRADALAPRGAAGP